MGFGFGLRGYQGLQALLREKSTGMCRVQASDEEFGFMLALCGRARYAGLLQSCQSLPFAGMSIQLTSGEGTMCAEESVHA